MSKGIPSKPSKRGWVHPQIKEVAIGFAEAMYDRLASEGSDASNIWYKLNPDRAVFVRRTWPDMIPQARRTLARMLTMPGYDEATKAAIHDALVADNTLREGRARGQLRRWGKATQQLKRMH